MNDGELLGIGKQSVKTAITGGSTMQNHGEMQANVGFLRTILMLLALTTVFMGAATVMAMS
jgi:hypothetical protein